VAALDRAQALTPLDQTAVLYALCITAPGPVLTVLDHLDALGGISAQRDPAGGAR
jgi:hypothetical protein